MAKIDYRIHILPDVEMYGGNTDTWELVLINENGDQYTYDELKDGRCTFLLTIKEYGYQHRPNGGVYYSLQKTGVLGTDDDMVGAVCRFTFAPGDTLTWMGKFTYQVELIQGNVIRHAAQGNLIIRKNINQ